MEQKSPGVDLGQHGFLDTGILFGGKGRKKGMPNDVFPAGNNISDSIINGRLVPEKRVDDDSADDYDAGIVTVSRAGDGELVMLLPHDTLRTRAIITNYGLFDIFIGKLGGGLSSGNGYPLKAGTSTTAGQSITTLNKGRLFGVVVPTAAAASICVVGVFIERDFS
jgi:hypothetical protein